VATRISTTWAADALAALTEAFDARRDVERAGHMSAYMRGQFAFIGIRSPERRAVQREVFATLPRPDAKAVIGFAEACWERDDREYQYAACDLLRRHAKLLGPDELPALERLITTRSWWDTVDHLAVTVGTIVQRSPDTRSVMDRWLDAENLWLVRVAILHQERSRDATDAGWLFAACRRHAGHTDFFIRKAIGWALRSFAKHDPESVRGFLDTDGALLSGLSRREAERGVAIGRARSTRSARG
jgi:3-methyladenine DNA glycosylase AlkD